MKALTGFVVGSLLWACPLCEILLAGLLPLATAWSIWRSGAQLPGRLRRFLACPPRLPR